jgi:hypothetical protein
VRGVFELRLTHPGIDSWVDVRLRRFPDAWVAVADLASTPELAVARRADLAVLLALWPLGPTLARRLAASSGLPGMTLGAFELGRQGQSQKFK